MASNKHVDLRKLENFVRSKGKKANFRKPCKNFKIVDEHLTYKRKRWVIFDNDRKLLIPQYHSILSQSNTHRKKNKPLKLFNIEVSYSFLFTRKLGSTYFPKEYSCTRKTTPRNIYLLEKYDCRVDISMKISTGELPLSSYGNNMFKSSH